MVMDLLNTILKDLETHLQVADLHTDKNESCLIRFGDQLEIQIEMDPLEICMRGYTNWRNSRREIPIDIAKRNA